MFHLLSKSVVKDKVNPPVSAWQAKALASGLYSRLQDCSKQKRLKIRDVQHIKEIMLPQSHINLIDMPKEKGETVAMVLIESGKDLGRTDKIGHAVLVTIRKVAELDYGVELFDSCNKEISPSIKKQLTNMLPPSSRVCVHHVPVQHQGLTNDFDCAYFVLAFLTHLCLGLRQELETVLFDSSQLRGHLQRCCKWEKVTEFPTIRNGKKIKIRDDGRRSIADYAW